MNHSFISKTDPLVVTASNILDEAAIKVPQKFVDHARQVGSTPGFAENTYRNWSKRGLTDKQIIDKITAHGESQKKTEEVELDEELNINKVLAYAKKIGGDVKGSTIDFGGGSVIKVSVTGDKIKFDGGKSSGIETFKSTSDAISALGQGIDEALEDYRPKSVSVRKIMNSFVMLDADDMEDMLFSITSYFAEEGIDSGKDFTNVAALMNKAALRWKARSGS